EVAVLALKRDELLHPRHRLPVALDELRLVVPRVDVTDGPGAEDEEDALRLRLEVRPARRERLIGSDVGTNRRALLRGEQRRQGDTAQAGTGVLQEGAAVEESASGRGENRFRHGEILVGE